MLFSRFKSFFGLDEASVEFATAASTGAHISSSLEPSFILRSDIAYSGTKGWNSPAGQTKVLVRNSISSTAYGPAEAAIDAPHLVGGYVHVPSGSVTRQINLALKRLIDIVGAGSALLLLSPMLLTVAAIITLTSKGPAFFRQERTGLDNKGFEIFKFRSMYVDRGDQSGVAQTRENDDRITPIGKFIRRTSIDELPQLLNVLRGDMSLIGPRPHVPGMLAGGVPYEELVPHYDLRHQMRPGLSGLAQVNGFRGPTTDPAKARGRVDYDLAYIRDFNVLLDIKIIFLTIWREFVTGSGF